MIVMVRKKAEYKLYIVQSERYKIYSDCGIICFSLFSNFSIMSMNFDTWREKSFFFENRSIVLLSLTDFEMLQKLSLVSPDPCFCTSADSGLANSLS